MKHRNPYTLYSRNNVWYYRVYDEDNKRLAFSTGQKTKAKANAFVMSRFKLGTLIPNKPNNKVVTFETYAINWWDWDKCLYIKHEKARGVEFSRRYCHNQMMTLKNHLIPAFGKMRLSQITVAKVEDWLFAKVDVDGKAPKTANNCLNALSVMLGEACRRELIKDNPCKKIKQLKPRCKQRGILTMEEVSKLFSSLKNWDNDIFAYAGNLLASCTGMRSREVAAIRGINLKKDHLEISESFDEMFGIKPTKTHDSRKLPLPQKVLDVLHSIKRGDDDYLFTLNGKKPVNQHFFLYALYDALEKIGVTKEERIKRNIVFHSWRHFLNSQLLANNISETKTQKITGHKTLEMTKHYAHFNAKDFQDVLEVTSEIISG